MSTALQRYFDKRDFSITSEPKGGEAAKADALSFVIQKHAATRLHYDFRLELDGTLKSWAVPKGPSLDPADKRMAVHVEDHPLGYASFEGVIPPKQYGAGTVIVWDRGTWEPVGDPRAGYAAGKLKFMLRGEKLHGGYTLVRMHGRGGERQEPWLLIKERDADARPAAEFSVVDAMPDSVLSDLKIPDDARPARAAAKAAPPTASRQAAGKAAGKAPGPAGEAPGKAARGVAAKRAPKTAAASSNKASTASPVAPTAPAAQPPDPEPARAVDGLPAGAVPAALPAAFTPQLATLVASAPSSAGWLYEIKFDGYRLLARIDGDEVRLFTRNGNDWTAKMQSLAREVQKLGLQSGWLDGEIVVIGANGAPDFNALQNAFDSSRTDTIQYYVFDIPYCNGHDLRNVPLVERRTLLGGLLAAAPGHGDPAASPVRIRFSHDFQASPDELLQNACRMRLEGVIGKRADSAYVSRRSPNWIKLKCTQRQEFVIGGYTDPQGARAGIGSLLLGIHDEAGNLRFAGGVGTGFDDDTLLMLKGKLDAIAADATPFVGKPRDVRGHWVAPTLVAEVSFGEWTKDGRVRHAVFHGLRTDKPATAITREHAEPADVVEHPAAAAPEASPDDAAKPQTKSAASTAQRGAPLGGVATAALPSSTVSAAPAPKATATKPAQKSASPSRAAEPTADALGVRISSPDRVIDASTGATKLDLVNHYLSVARLMLPHLSGRPVSLVRAPAGIDGQLFFQRHAEALKIAELKKLDAAIMPGKPPMVEVDSFTALISAAQANVVEFHTWNATARSIASPDRMIFDLDPGEGVAWQQIQEATALTRTLLGELGLASFLKTSGGKGLHVVVPLTPKDDWDTVKGVSQAIVQHLAEVVPSRFVAKSGPKNRVGKIFVDYLRNGFGATTAAAYSARARPGLGVSVPCGWDELATLTGGSHWTIANLHERLEEPTDPWRAYAGTRQTLGKAMKNLGI